jgi:valyl-tRNA synthetase
MSKSLGNSPDPLDLIDKYGADGLRFGLMRIAPSGQDIRFDEKQIEEGRNFATKLWNVARFRQMQGPVTGWKNTVLVDAEGGPVPLSIFAIEVLARLNETIDTVEAAFRGYEFNSAAQKIYDFVWSDFCDWFVEAAKTDIFGQDENRKTSTLVTIDVVLSAVLRLLHPFMPHLTEELWSQFVFGERSIQFEPLPVHANLAHEGQLSALRQNVRAIYDTVQAGRNLRAEAKIASNQKAKFALRPNTSHNVSESETIARLLNASELLIDPKFKPAAGMPIATTPLGDLVLVVEVDRAAERDRLEKEIARIEEELRTVQSKLDNKSFVDRAPAAVVEEHRQRQKNFAEQLEKLREARKEL